MDLDDLLRHRAWIRDLALALTRRECEADDVSQDTVLAALRGSPRDPLHPRAWLAAVVRNFARRRHRAAVRRATHEAAASCRHPSREPDPAALAARAEIHSIVVAAVVALEEPYRAAVLLRHFEGLPVAEVARRTGVPLETARARLRRGREMLRARLARRVGGESPLSALLLPLLDTGSGAASGGASTALVAAGASIMTTRVVVSVVAIVTITLGLVGFATRKTDPSVPVRSVVGLGSEQGPPPRPAESPPAGPPGAGPGAVPKDSAPDGSLAARRPPGIAARLEATLPPGFTVDGAPLREALARLSGLAGVPVHVDDRLRLALDATPVTLRLEAVSARDAFRLLAMLASVAFTIEEDRIVLHPLSTPWTPGLPCTLVTPILPDPSERPVRRVSGTVRDPAGRPVAAAVLLDGIEVARAGEDGAYAFETRNCSLDLRARAPLAQTVEPVRLAADGRETVEQDLRIGDPAGALDLVVTSPAGAVEKAAATIEWSVPTPDGVSPRRETLRTGPGGRATFETLPPGTVRVSVAAAGLAPESRTVRIAAGERTPLPVALRAATLEDRLREERVSCRFQDATLCEVVEYVSRTTRITILLDPDLPGEVADAVVSLDVTGDTIENMLRTLCDLAGRCTFAVEAGAVVIRAPRR